jgi:EAL domain-containing protein (putative c-di-GMP-specific phosphodiesterase class I)
MLRAYGVDYAQGFYVGRPAPLAEIELPSIGSVGGG